MVSSEHPSACPEQPTDGGLQQHCLGVCWSWCLCHTGHTVTGKCSLAVLWIWPQFDVDVVDGYLVGIFWSFGDCCRRSEVSPDNCCTSANPDRYPVRPGFRRHTVLENCGYGYSPCALRVFFGDEPIEGGKGTEPHAAVFLAGTLVCSYGLHLRRLHRQLPASLDRAQPRSCYFNLPDLCPWAQRSCLVCFCLMGLYRGYVGIMEKKMEATI